MFIDLSGQDMDIDGIDDICDPDTSHPRPSYQSRPGDPTRTHNGAPEKANYIYIERNIHATNTTGIAGDSDPDNDGWAVIAVSQGLPYSTTSIPDTGPIANSELIGTGTNTIPHVYIRAGSYGCVDYKPQLMSVVTPNQSRPLERVATNTNKCRKEAPTVDVDQNSQPDNIQPLYLARNGIASIHHTKPNGTTFTEDPTKLYLFRSSHAAEAQLGISDYSPTGIAANPEPQQSQPITQWNLIASSQSILTSAKYNKLVILSTTVNNKTIQLPTIAAKIPNILGISLLCTAFQPKEYAIILTKPIQSQTQYTNDLKRLLMSPQGVGCE